MAQVVLWQRVEAFGLFVVGLALSWHWNGGLTWWAAILIFFAPDLSFLGYVFGPKAGALWYNLAHIYAFGAALLTIGLVTSMPLLVVLGALWLAHCGFDRMLGYGLKSPEGFAWTHLGRIGKQRSD